MKEVEGRFYEWELLDINKNDLIVSMSSGNLIAIVDEDKGGIVGYLLRGNEGLIQMLNQQDRKEKFEEKLWKLDEEVD